MKCHLDFIIPLCSNNIIIRTVIESIFDFYSPKNIYIITQNKYIDEIKKEYIYWNINYCIIIFIDEDNFFLDNYHLTKKDIEQFYIYKDEKSREFGWWYQQILKLGAIYQIKNLSDPYVVWDADLIPLIKWELNLTPENPYYKFAILQENPKNIFNEDEYKKSIKNIINLDTIHPEEGTFVPHHFIIHHNVIKDMLSYIENNKKENKENKENNKIWIQIIIELSNKYYRFSEYKCLATYMNYYYKDLLKYYPFDEYGKSGIRYRENKEILNKLLSECNIKNGISYNDFKNFVKNNYKDTPSYIQIEHL